MKFQGRGKVYLAERDVNGKPGAFVEICPDSFVVALATESFEHINKCGPVDVPDYRGVQSVSGTVTFAFTDVEDLKFAIATLGAVNALAGSPTAVTNEVFPDNLVAGDIVFLGEAEPKRGITSLVLQDSATSPATLVLNTDYTLDAASGKVTILDPSGFNQPFVADYSHQSPATVALLAVAQKEYFVRMENINKANANDPGSFELYKVRFDPASNIDMMTDELQVLEMVGTALADETKASNDTVYGQFGRRVL